MFKIQNKAKKHFGQELVHVQVPVQKMSYTNFMA